MSFPCSLNFKTSPLYLESFRNNPKFFTIDEEKRFFSEFESNAQSLMHMIAQINTIKALVGPQLPDFNVEVDRSSDFEKMQREHLFSENLYETLNVSLEESLTEAFTIHPIQTIKTALIAEEFFYRELGVLQDAFCNVLLAKTISDQENAIFLLEKIDYIERLCISSNLKPTILEMKAHIKTQFSSSPSDSGFSSSSPIFFEDRLEFEPRNRKRPALFLPD